MSQLKKIFNKFLFRPYLKVRLRKVGRDFRFGYSGDFECPQSFSFGDNFFSGPYSYFSSNIDTPIVIGSNVMFGPYCKVIGGNHNITWTDGSMMNAPYLGGGSGVVIEDDVWLGAGSTILDGAYISEGTVIAAGAVVTCKTIPYSVYGGVPARFIKFRFDKDELKKIRSKQYDIEDLLKNYE